MISFKRDGSTVGIAVTVQVPNYDGRVYHTQWNAGGEAYAGFLSAAMNEQMREALRNIRKEAYEQGWKDAKAKRTKENWFGGWW